MVFCDNRLSTEEAYNEALQTAVINLQGEIKNIKGGGHYPK